MTAAPPVNQGVADRGPRPATFGPWLLVPALAATAVGGLLAVVAGPLVSIAVIGAVLVCVGLFVASAYRPIVAVYVYLGTLPIIAGIDRNQLLPLVRPNEAVLALVVAGACLGGYLRYCRGDAIPFRPHPLDLPLAAFLILSTAWPLASFMLRGHQPEAADVAAILPVCKLVGIYLLVRLAVTTEKQIERCIRLIIWPGAVIAVIAILQTLQFGPVVWALATFWSPEAQAGAIEARGTTTLSSPIATGDYIIISLVLLICCAARGLLGRRERFGLGFVLCAGVLAAGQFSTWISAAVAATILLWRYPELRRRALRFWPIAPVAFAIGAPAFITRLEGFGDLGVPQSWLGRWDNLSNFYLPRFEPLNVLIGVEPNPVLQAPETWREVIYLESGVLEFLWIGGIPLLAGFVWLSVVVLRSSYRLVNRYDVVGAVGSALVVCWWFLLVLTVLDPHLTLRGTGDLLFTLMAIVSGRLGVSRQS